MKKVTVQNEPVVVNERKGLKFMSALTMALPMLLGTSEKVFADTGYKEHDSIPTSVTFPQQAHQTKTYVSFDAYSKLEGGNVPNEPGVADRWTDQYGDQMFCTEPLLYTPKGQYNQTYAGTPTQGMVAILRSGWPAKSSQELGCGDDADAAFYATQLAVWMETSTDAWKGNPGHVTWIKENGIHWTSPDGSASQAETNKVKAAYEKIRADADKIRGTTATSSIELKEGNKISTNEGGASKTYQAVTKNPSGKLDEAPVQIKVTGSSLSGTTKIIQDGKVVGQANADGSGNVTVSANVQSNKNFTIETPPAVGNSTVSVNATTDKSYVLTGFGVPGNQERKEQASYSLIALKTKPISAASEYHVDAAFIKFNVRKIDDRLQTNPLPGVTFKLYKAAKQVKGNTELGESIGSFTTDNNGYFTTGNLKMGYYVLVEDKVPSNIKINKTPIAVDASSAAVKANGGNLTINVPHITNQYQDVTASSIATNAEDGSKTLQSIDGPVTVNEKLHFTQLQTNAPYKVRAWLVDKATGNPITIDGKKVEVEKTFTAGNKAGDKGVEQDVDVQLNIPNAKSLAGKEVVAFAEGEQTEKTTDGKVYSFSHKDINDKNETVRFTKPELQTQAVNKETDSNRIQPTNKETIVDTIKYKDLIPGKTYTVKGKLMDKQTGKPVMNNGKEVTFTKIFTPESSSGSIKSEVQFDAHEYSNHDLVAFEDLYYNDHQLAIHEDINDKDQTVHVTHPEVHTKAANKETGENELQPTDGETLVDTIMYKDLIAGKTYTVKGIVIDKQTGKAVMNNGKKVEFEKTFTPTSSDGEVKSEVKFDAHHYWNHDLVVYETLYYNDYQLVAHRDINDKSQTVHVTHPQMHTTLSSNAQKLVKASENNTADDIIRYTDLIPGKEYTIRGKLMDQVTGLPVVKDGVPIVATARFTPTTKNGTVTVTFKFNGKPYQGHTLVAFQTLYDNGRVVMEHADLDDMSESIVIDHTNTQVVLPPAGGSTVIVNNNNNNSSNNNNNNASNNSSNNASNNASNNSSNSSNNATPAVGRLVSQKTVLPNVSTVQRTPNVVRAATVSNSTLPQTGSSNDVIGQLLGLGLVTLVAGAAVEYVRRHDAVGLK